jgi:S-adenosylmethionine:tRNA ribosyltransferase-isomerase
MNVDLFDFDLPRALIAERPAVPRDSARLLHVGRAGLNDHIVRDLPQLLRPGDLVISNDTKVIPARLTGRRGTAKVEVTLMEALASDCWNVLAKPARKLKQGDRIAFAEDFFADVVERGEGGAVTLSFSEAGAALMAALDHFGRMPLPPYIRRPTGADAQDASDYQTLFAAQPGAVAAPTAGLHFTPQLLAALDARGVERLTVTLHVGAGTFLPVTASDTTQHKMHFERGELTAEAAARVNDVRQKGGRIVAIGSTSTRLLEAASDEQGVVKPFHGRTDIFITPGYRFRVVDVMMTNFHLPRSTLFMMVAAFCGLERMHHAYRHAMDQGYRFYSYGDASLLEKQI